MSWLCRVGIHKWCRHPEIRSGSPVEINGKIHVHYRCTTCGLEHEHEPVTGKWLPVSDEKRCLRCGENHPS